MNLKDAFRAQNKPHSLCDAKQATTINFDHQICGMAAELGRKADEVSAQVDRSWSTPPWTMRSLLR